MENCLVKKLKAVVNNPNLPFLEVMQQFTLDAITFSGNNSLTDAQKIALNHFFYQIGAIDNTQTYQKVKAMFIPLIGSGLSTALNDYKNNKSLPVAAANVTFSDGSLVYSSTSSINVQTDYDENWAIAANNISMAILDTTGTEFRLYNYYNGQTNKIKAMTYNNSGSKQMRTANDPYITKVTAYAFTVGETITGASGLTMRDSDIYGCYYGENGIQECTVTENEQLREISATNIAIYINSASRMKVAILGENFTSSELNTMVTAIHELGVAFATE